MMFGVLLGICSDLIPSIRTSRSNILFLSIGSNSSLKLLFGLVRVSFWSKTECESLKMRDFLGVGKDS